MLTRMVSISWPRDPPASASQSAGITGVSHCTRPIILILHKLFQRKQRTCSTITIQHIWSNFSHSLINTGNKRRMPAIADICLIQAWRPSQKQRWGQEKWPVLPALWETEAGGLPEPRITRPAWATSLRPRYHKKKITMRQISTGMKI